MTLGKLQIQNMVVATLAASGLAACMGGPGMGGFGARKQPPEMLERVQAAISERAKLKRFDADANKEITKAELESGLETMFAKFDSNRDHVLRASEIAKANEVLAAEDATMPPVRDWNQSGAVEFEEFAAWDRGKFRRADTDQDGTVTAAELTVQPRTRSGPPDTMRPEGRPPGGKPQGGGGMPGGRLSQSVATVESGGL